VESVNRALTDARPVNVKDFIVPATVGTMAGLVAGIATRKLLDGQHDSTKDAAAYLVNSGVFLIVGGLLFVWRQARAR
jgi:hypothetical protein